MDGRVDILLVETVFDTINAKAALFAFEKYFEDTGRRVPVMVSVTITDNSGRKLSGQTVEAFWNSISHIDFCRSGINCALGGKQMRPYVQELSRNRAGLHELPSERRTAKRVRRLRRTPSETSAILREFAANGWVNIVGGCCGTTPQHIRAIAGSGARSEASRSASTRTHLRLSGLEPLTFRPDSAFVNIGERTNVTGSPRFAKFILGRRIRRSA